jgi:pyruvate kinase
MVSPDAADVDDMVRLATAAVNALCPDALARTVAIVAGMPFGTPGATNTLRLLSL